MRTPIGYALHLVNALSFDVVVGSVLSSYFVSRLLAAKMPLAWWILLSAAVWVIYTVDHLLDAVVGQRNLVMLRHQLHRRYVPILSITAGLITLVSVTSAFCFLPTVILTFGLLLSAIVALYLVAVHSRFSFSLGLLSMKELTVATLYTAGIWGGPLLLSNKSIAPQILLAISCFYCSALGNLLVLSLYEADADKQSSMASYCTMQGRRTSELSMGILVASMTLFAALLAAIATDEYFFWYGVATVFVALLFIGLSRLHLHGRAFRYYRPAVDSIFTVVPGSLLLFV